MLKTVYLVKLAKRLSWFMQKHITGYTKMDMVTENKRLSVLCWIQAEDPMQSHVWPKRSDNDKTMRGCEYVWQINVCICV